MEHVAASIFARAAQHPDARALRERTADGWAEQTYADVVAQARHVCHGLIAAGLHPGDAVAIISDNRPEWLVAELAALAASGVVIHLGPTRAVEELAAILRETEARVAFVSGGVLTERLSQLAGRLPSLRVVICFDDDPAVLPMLDDLSAFALGTAVDELGVDVGTHGTFAWSRLLAAPFDIATAAEAQRRRDLWSPDDVAFIDYTIGGAGELRGVVLSHRSVVVTTKAVAEKFQVTTPLHEVATLPMHHAVQHGSSLLALLSGGSVTMVGDLDQVGPLLREARPSMLITTMPVLRRLVQDALRQIAQDGLVGPGLVRWSRDVATSEGLRRGHPRPPTLTERVRAAVARRAVGGALADRMGGPKDVFLVGGSGAPPDLLSLLDLAGIPAHRSWSLHEAAAFATCNAPGASRAGSVGRPLSCVEVQVLEDSGEVLLRGPGLMRGYFGLPAETRRVIRDGWLHTGQIGKLDQDGYLHLTSRMDDMIVTESLHYVAPYLVESRLRAMPMIADVVVLGDGRSCLTAVVEPDLEHAQQVRVAGGALATDDLDELVSDPVVVRAVGDAVRQANSSLAQDQRVQAFRLSRTSLGALGPGTAGMMRRQRLEREGQAVIDGMYASLLPDPDLPPAAR